jgi:hypothetical protein
MQTENQNRSQKSPNNPAGRGWMGRLVMRLWTYPLHCKTILWTRRIRIFCDGGCPNFRWMPRFRRQHYAAHWEMTGFAIYLWGREINFSFGVDRKGLYSPHNSVISKPVGISPL